MDSTYGEGTRENETGISDSYNISTRGEQWSKKYFVYMQIII